MNLQYEHSIVRGEARYAAFITHLQAVESEIELVEANHIHGYGKQDVSIVDISSSKISVMPNIGNHFHNLTILSIFDCGLKELSKQDFSLLNRLEALFLSNNLIESLPADVFESVPQLTHLSLRNNKIKFISKHTLTPLACLTLADFSGNITIDEVHDYCNAVSSSGGITLRDLRVKIFKQCKPPNEQISTVARYAHQLWLGLLSDFRIKAKEEVFDVHKAVLAANSPVFANLFSQESEADVKNEMTIENFQPETVKELLAFVYLREVPENRFNATDLYAMAHMYEINELLEQIEWHIFMEINADNASDMFKFGVRYKNALIKRAAFHAIEDSLKRNLPEKLLSTEERLLELIDVKDKLDDVLKRIEKT